MVIEIFHYDIMYIFHYSNNAEMLLMSIFVLNKYKMMEFFGNQCLRLFNIDGFQYLFYDIA